MLEFILPVVQSVLGNYITSRLVEKKSPLSRAELAGEVERQLQAAKVELRAEIAELVVREIDAIVSQDSGLTWHKDYLEIEASGRLRKVMPTPEKALQELEESIRERRRLLGLPLKSAPDPGLGDLIPPAPEPSETPAGKGADDWQLRVAGLQGEVRREKERRLREAREDG